MLVVIAVVIVPMILLTGAVLTALKTGASASVTILIPAVLAIVLLASILNIKIGISGDLLVIRYVLFGVKIPIHDIQVVNDTAVNRRLTMMALNFATSPGWLEIGYLVRGKKRWVTVSPADKLGLMNALSAAHPALVLSDSKLLRSG